MIFAPSSPQLPLVSKLAVVYPYHAHISIPRKNRFEESSTKLFQHQPSTPSKTTAPITAVKMVSKTILSLGYFIAGMYIVGEQLHRFHFGLYCGVREVWKCGRKFGTYGSATKNPTRDDWNDHQHLDIHGLLRASALRIRFYLATDDFPTQQSRFTLRFDCISMAWQADKISHLGQHSENPQDLLQGQGLPQAHPAQGHTIQGWQGRFKSTPPHQHQRR